METKAHLSDRVTEREQRNRQLAYEAATEGIVLLENNGVLPVAPCAVALYGAGARHTVRGGSGSGEVNVRHTVSVEEGLLQAGFTVTTTGWLDRYDEQWRAGKEAFIRRVRRKLRWPSARVLDSLMSQEYIYPVGDAPVDASGAANAICLYVLSRLSGEGRDMTDTPGSFRLDDAEIRNIRFCAERYERFVLVINAGCPIDLSPLDKIKGIGAIVYMGQLGMEGGRALAAILTGECDPSGKLAVSWPQRYADIPFGEEFGRNDDRAFYREGIYVGYRYYDSFGVAPRYPFGYGLSYTSFAITEQRAKSQEPRAKSQEPRADVRIAVTVANTGSRVGKQVVQAYVRCPGEDCECRRLVAFAKTDELQPGQSQVLELVIPLTALSRYIEDGALTVIEQGRYLVELGCSSRDVQPVASLRVGERIVLCKHRNLCTAEAKVAVLHHRNTFAIPDGLPEFVVDSKAFATQTIDYTEREERFSPQVQAMLDDLSADDCAQICTGTGMNGEKQGFRTSGAVGHTTTAYIARGIPNIEICDGPAGVRLERRAVRYANGDIRAVDMSLSVYEFFPRWLLRMFLLGDPQRGELLYQFVTGFPVEAMVAQTWNVALSERIGRAVSEEMSEYGVTFWLAPAMNIVRNPLCGRNYEYYSEDPLLTGLFAAAVTRGVQATPGNYVTIKHFSANNQETNRFHVSSEVDERVLREIYWRGFEIAVRDAKPRSVMAAYNRLNGTYCPNSRELCIDLLRSEWGFDGLVMTDWFGTDRNRANAVEAIRTGVDMNMPGDRKIVRALQQAHAAGRLSEADLRRAAGRVLEAIVNGQSPS